MRALWSLCGNSRNFATKHAPVCDLENIFPGESGKGPVLDFHS